MLKIVVAISDTHGGYKLGLMPPDIELFDEGENGQVLSYRPELTATQVELAKLYKSQMDKVVQIANGNEIVVFHTGDMCHGDRYPHQLVSTRLSDQVSIAAANLEPWLKLPNVRSMRMFWGTEAHGFGEGSAEVLVCERLQGKYQDKDIKTMNHAIMDVCGVQFDCAHHGPGVGMRNWLRGNVARLFLRSYMEVEIKYGNVPPRFVLRGHVHDYIEVTESDLFYGQPIQSTLMILPSFTFPDLYARKVTKQTSRVTCGMAYFVLNNGRVLDYSCLHNTYDIRTREEL